MKKSAMSKGGTTQSDGTSRKKQINLDFTASEKIPIASREYGLMRSTNKSSTPYPRVDRGVDANALTARLTTSGLVPGAKRIVDPKSPETSPVNSSYRFSKSNDLYDSKNVSVQADTKLTQKELLSMGTPHPRRGVAINARKLKRQLSQLSELSQLDEELSKSASETYPGKIKKKGRISTLHSESAESKLTAKELLSLGTPHPSKGVAVNARSLNRRLTDINESLTKDAPAKPSGNTSQPKKKKISMMNSESVETIASQGRHMSDPPTKRLSKNSSFGSSSYIALLDSKKDFSFEERRRRFDRAEFTITKNTRKMSEVMMAAEPNVHTVTTGDASMEVADKAHEEIEKYIQEQGLVKLANNQLRILRSADSRTSPSSPKAHTEEGRRTRRKSPVVIG